MKTLIVFLMFIPQMAFSAETILTCQSGVRSLGITIDRNDMILRHGDQELRLHGENLVLSKGRALLILSGEDRTSFLFGIQKSGGDFVTWMESSVEGLSSSVAQIMGFENGMPKFAISECTGKQVESLNGDVRRPF